MQLEGPSQMLPQSVATCQEVTEWVAKKQYHSLLEQMISSLKPFPSAAALITGMHDPFCGQLPCAADQLCPAAQGAYWQLQSVV